MKKGEPKTLTYLSLVAVVLVLAGLAYAVVHNHMPVKETAWALTPPVIAIALALITKEVYSSLFLGVLTGAFLNAGFDLVGTLNQVFQEGMLKVLSDKWNVGILIFLIILGMMVQLMNRAGGSAAFGQWASTHIKSRAGAQLATMVLGCLIFIDDYFNCLTVGSVMRPVTDKYNISRAKLAYLIDSTAAPVCIIAPISSWAAAVSGFVKGENGISIFIQSIPYNFYALLTLIMMLLIIFLGIDYGPMKVHEDNALKGDLFTTGITEEAAETMKKGEKIGSVIDLVLPIVMLIICCVIGMIYTGGFFEDKGFVDAFANSDASVGLVLLSVASVPAFCGLHGLPAGRFQTDGSGHADPVLCLGFKGNDRQPGRCQICGGPGGKLSRQPDELPAGHHLPDCGVPGLRLRHFLGYLRYPNPHRGFLFPGC